MKINVERIECVGHVRKQIDHLQLMFKSKSVIKRRKCIPKIRLITVHDLRRRLRKLESESSG